MNINARYNIHRKVYYLSSESKLHQIHRGIRFYDTYGILNITSILISVVINQILNSD